MMSQLLLLLILRAFIKHKIA